MSDEKTNKIMSSEELDDVLPKYEPLKLSGKNLAQNYVSAFNTGMNIYQCINYLQGNIDWTINAVNDVVKSWNTEVSESIDQSKAIVRETTTEQFNTEWTNKQPELIEQVNTLTTNQFNEDWGVLENRINTTLETQNTNIENIQNEQNTLSSAQTTLSNRMDTFTSLSEGSTTGDAELKDIRVGANGITYNNAGDAVRGQYSQLKEDYIGNGISPIKKFGAVGDGITDDYTAFQTAINNKTIKEITLEPKTYLIKHILRITDRSTIKITGNGATIKFDVGDAVNLNDYCFEVANMNGIIIENCIFDGGYEWIDRPLHTDDTYQNYLDIRAKARHAFRLTNCSQFSIKNVTVKNTLAGFWLTGCTHGNITNCKSLNTLADSVFLVGSHDISVFNHYSNNIDDDSYVSINYSNNTANYANSFDNCYTAKGFGALCCFYGSYSATIRNSRIDECSYTPLKLGAHNPYNILGSQQVVENCTIKLSENIDNYTDNTLNICEGISTNNRATNIIIKNVTFSFKKSEGYKIRFINVSNIDISNFNNMCNLEFQNCNNINITNSSLTNVTLNSVVRTNIRSTSLNSISAINVSKLISLGNSYSTIPNITFNGNSNSLCIIDNNNIVNNGNNHFLMTTNSLLPAGSPHLAFLIGTILHSGGKLIYVTNNGFKTIATD